MERGYFQLAIGSESLHHGSTDNDVRIVNFPHQKENNLVVSKEQRSLMWKEAK